MAMLMVMFMVMFMAVFMAMSDEYKNYVNDMWRRNCIERDAWGQPVYTREHYEKENAEFLKDQFYVITMGDKKWVDGKYK